MLILIFLYLQRWLVKVYLVQSPKSIKIKPKLIAKSQPVTLSKALGNLYLSSSQPIIQRSSWTSQYNTAHIQWKIWCCYSLGWLLDICSWCMARWNCSLFHSRWPMASLLLSGWLWWGLVVCLRLSAASCWFWAYLPASMPLSWQAWWRWRIFIFIRALIWFLIRLSIKARRQLFTVWYFWFIGWWVLVNIR